MSSINAATLRRLAELEEITTVRITLIRSAEEIEALEAKVDLLTAALDKMEAGRDRLYAAIRAISEGKRFGIEADDGKKCWIVHSDLIHAAEVAAELI